MELNTIKTKQSAMKWMFARQGIFFPQMKKLKHLCKYSLMLKQTNCFQSKTEQKKQTNHQTKIMKTKKTCTKTKPKTKHNRTERKKEIKNPSKFRVTLDVGEFGQGCGRSSRCVLTVWSRWRVDWRQRLVSLVHRTHLLHRLRPEADTVDVSYSWTP